jgi:hypothetical protein
VAALLHADLARQRRDPERAITFAQKAQASLTDADQALHAMVGWQLAMADWMRGRPAPAERILAEIVTEPYLLSFRPWYDLGHVQQTQGRLGAAADMLSSVGYSGRGWRWPRAGPPTPPAGCGSAGWGSTTSSATSKSGSTWCWPGCCWPSNALLRHCGCWRGCTPWRQRRGGWAA